MKLAGRHAIITGASQGLGAVIAECFLAEGASVFLCARNLDMLEAQRTRLQSGCHPEQRVLACATDVADAAQVDAMVATALAGFPKIDILVNNAGVYGPMGNFEDIDWPEWTRAIEINLYGTAYPTRALLPHFKQRRYGKVVCLSGGGATNPMPRISAYAAAKAAVVRLVETLALEVKPFNIDINAIAPGTLATRMLAQVIDAGPNLVGADFHTRMTQIQNQGGTPLETGAALAVYLASAESDSITGRLLSAVWDPWASLQDHRADLDDSDIYTLRRIVPQDRAKTWGNK